MDIKVLVAAHKPYVMPEGDMYLPLQVGAALHDDFGIQKDNEGDNISDKNPYYCELTGLYWLWKNSNAEVKGLVHYRRHFALKPKTGDIARVLTTAELEELLKGADIVVPRKRKYYVESLYSHYAHSHYEEHLVLSREIISQLYPEYLQSFDVALKRKWGYMFNMFIAPETIYNQYCEWLFAILSELESQIDITQYDAFQARLYGRVSELLFNVWLCHNNFSLAEVPVESMEKVKWGSKISSFLKAKFGKKKYKHGF